MQYITPFLAFQHLHCHINSAYPFPNDYWLIKDSDGTPLHLNFSESTFPIADLPIKGQTINPSNWNKLNGFSPIPAILTFFDDVSISNCARLWNISQSLDSDSPIIILESTTNNQIPHWVELDHSSDTRFTEARNRSLMIWPAHRLIDGQNYIVAIRSLKSNKGTVIEPSPAFKSLRDNITTDDPSIESRRRRYHEFIFPELVRNGVDINSLQLCWEFTVQSTKMQTKTMVKMRDDAFKRIKSDNNNIDNIHYHIQKVVEYPFPNIARKVVGTMKVPWYLNQRIPGPQVRIVRNKDDWFGLPQFQRMEEVEFEVLIPMSLINGTLNRTQSRFLQFGHGLFGHRSQIEDKWIRKYANRYGYILGAVDWMGMSAHDVEGIVEMISLNLTNFPMIPDRLHQGMLNALCFMKLLISPAFVDDDIFVFNGSGTVLSKPYKRNFYGNSLGGIMGTVYMALTTDVTRGTAGVPGAPFSLILPRSQDFSAIFDVIKSRYHRDSDRILLLSLFQLLWTALDPSGYISHINGDDLFPNTPMHSILFHYSLGDEKVTWLGAQQLGRAAGCFMFESQVAEYNETYYGFETIGDDVVIDINKKNHEGDCLIQGWNYDLPQVPFINKPPTVGNAHESTKRQDDAHAANYRFWSEGIIYNACKGPCNVKKSDIEKQ